MALWMRIFEMYAQVAAGTAIASVFVALGAKRLRDHSVQILGDRFEWLITILYLVMGTGFLATFCYLNYWSYQLGIQLRIDTITTPTSLILGTVQGWLFVTYATQIGAYTIDILMDRFDPPGFRS